MAFPDRRAVRAATLGAGIAAGVLAVTLAACSGSDGTTAQATAEASPTPSPQTSASPTSSLGMEQLVASKLTVADGTEAGPAAGRSLNLPSGWKAEVWANVPGARMAVWTPDDRLIVSTGDDGTLSLLTPTSDGRAPRVTKLADNLENPQGVAMTEDDGREVLVLGETTRIVAWDYHNGRLTRRRVVVDGLPSGGHGAKMVAVRNGVVYYNVGSRTNRDPSDRTSKPVRATIEQIGLDGTGHRIIATGVRNGEGLSFAPDGTLFSAINQGDNQPYPFDDDQGKRGSDVRSYVNEHPNDQISRITTGLDLGWPLCVPDSRGHEDLTNLPYVNDPVNNPDGDHLDCGSLQPTMLGLPAHSAPVGFVFTQGSALPENLGDGALITAHGSWNRQPPRPPFWQIAHFPSSSSRPAHAAGLHIFL